MFILIFIQGFGPFKEFLVNPSWKAAQSDVFLSRDFAQTCILSNEGRRWRKLDWERSLKFTAWRCQWAMLRPSRLSLNSGKALNRRLENKRFGFFMFFFLNTRCISLVVSSLLSIWALPEVPGFCCWSNLGGTGASKTEMCVASAPKAAWKVVQKNCTPSSTWGLFQSTSKTQRWMSFLQQMLEGVLSFMNYINSGVV